MELRDVLNQMMQENLRASQPANLCIGTVTAADPLEITISTGMGPLKKPILYLTSAVIEKKIPVLKHKHTTKGFRHSHTVDGLSHTHSGEEGETGPALDGAYPTGEGLEQDAFISDEQLKEIILADLPALFRDAVAGPDWTGPRLCDRRAPAAAPGGADYGRPGKGDFPI